MEIVKNNVPSDATYAAAPRFALPFWFDSCSYTSRVKHSKCFYRKLPRAFCSRVTVGFCALGRRAAGEGGAPSELSPVAGALCDVRSRPSLSEPLAQPF